MELHGKVAIITGASSGIGKAIAQDLDAAGMNLVLTARSQDKLNQLAASLKNASVVAATITDPEVPQKVVDFAIATFGWLDMVLNNGGGMTLGAIEDVDIEAICQSELRVVVKETQYPIDRLSSRELEVLKLIIEGFSNPEIAATLHVSPHTIKTHVGSILNKFGVNHRIQAAVLAVRNGLIK